MNDALVQQLLAKARKSLTGGDKLAAIVWHGLAKQAKACGHRI